MWLRCGNFALAIELSANAVMIAEALVYDMLRQAWWRTFINCLEAPEAHAIKPSPICTFADAKERRKWSCDAMMCLPYLKSIYCL